MRSLLLATLVTVSLQAQNTGFGGIKGTGIMDNTGAQATSPMRKGSGSPSGRDNCTQAELYWQTDATAGQNIWGCTASGAPGTWVQQGSSTTGGAQSAFASCTAVVVSSSATPAFNFGDVTGPKSRCRVEFTPTVDVAAPTFTNTSPGASMWISIHTDGVHRFTWNSTISGASVCTPYTDVANTVLALVQVAADGTTVTGGPCVGGPQGAVAVGPYGTAAAVNPIAGNIACFTTVADGVNCLTPGGIHFVMVPSTALTHTIQIPIAGAPIVTGTTSVGISTSSYFVCTSFVNVTIDANTSGSMTANVLKNGSNISASAPVTLASAQTNNAVTLTGWTVTAALSDKWSANVLTADGVLTGALVTITCQ